MFNTGNMNEYEKRGWILYTIYVVLIVFTILFFMLVKDDSNELAKFQKEAIHRGYATYSSDGMFIRNEQKIPQNTERQ